MRGFVQFLFAFALAAPLDARAARPFVTDDARIVDEGGYQIETFVKHQRKFKEQEFWFLPAHNPFGRVELTLGGTAIHSALDGKSNSLIAQAKTLLKPLERNRAGYALTIGVTRVERASPAPIETAPYVNGIGSYSFADDSVVMHTNLGARRDREAGLTRGSWGIGVEILLSERLYGIAETYGERGQEPTRHFGVRYWVVPQRVQIDGTLGVQNGNPARLSNSIGLRLLF
jgi:hypothetical protein